jgi:hypothetical protein
MKKKFGPSFSFLSIFIDIPDFNPSCHIICFVLFKISYLVVICL